MVWCVMFFCDIIVWHNLVLYVVMVWLWHVVRRWYCWVSTIWRRNRFWATAGELSMLLWVYISLSWCCVCRPRQPPYHAMPYGIMLSHAIRMMLSKYITLTVDHVWRGRTVHNVLWSQLHDFSKRDHQSVIWERQVCKKMHLQKLRKSQTEDTW